MQTHKVPREIWIELYNLTKERQPLEVYQGSLGFCVIRMGLKYLSLEMIDEALYLAFQSKLPQLLTATRHYAVKKRNVMVHNLIDFHEEKANPGNPSSLVKSMTQIANFSQKQLRKEDYNNLYKDFETLLKIDDITDLELTDFNGWEINLEQYQRALDLEFSGSFAEAEQKPKGPEYEPSGQNRAWNKRNT